MAEDTHNAECPEGPHMHMPGGAVMQIALAGFGSNPPAINERLTNKGEYSELFVAALFIMSKVAVEGVDGPAGADPTARLYWELAEASMANDLPRMFKATTDLFVVLAGKQGAPPNPAEAMAEMLALAAEIADIVGRHRERNKERAAEGVSVDNGTE